MRTSKILVATAMMAATFALGACSNSDEPEVVDITKPIQMNIGVGGATQTRVAIVNPTGFETDDAIGIYLATAEKNTAPADASTAVSAEINAGKAVNNVKFTKTADSWGGVIYWQNTSQWHTLYGYYPYDSALSGTSTETTTKAVTVVADQNAKGTVNGVTEVAGAGYKNADYLWAKNEPTLATTSSQTMALMHRMSRIVIKLTAGNDLSQDELTALAPSLKILNKNNEQGKIPQNGTFNVTTGDITIKDDATKIGEITPYRVEGTVGIDSKKEKEYSYYAILLPGTSFTQGSDFVQLTATDGTVYLYKLGTPSDLGLEKGKEYTFTLKANKTGIDLSSFTIKAWESGDSANGGADMVVPTTKP